MKENRSRFFWIAWLLLWLAPIHPAASESAGQVSRLGLTAEENVSAYRIREALLRLREARMDFETAESLHTWGLISSNELTRRRIHWRAESLRVSSVVRAAVGEAIRIMVAEAARYRAADGALHVSLLLRVANEGLPPGLEIPPYLFAGGLHRCEVLYVSLLHGGAIVGQPYEMRCRMPRAGQSIRLDFRLLEETDRVVVRMDHCGATEEKNIILTELGTTGGGVKIRCNLISQEVPLGETAHFPITIEHPIGTEHSVRLEVSGLPREMRCGFIDPAKGARLTSLLLPATEREYPVDLQVSAPERVSREVVPGEALAFLVRIRAEESSTAGAPSGGAVLDSLQLEVIPRGRGELSVRCANLYVTAAKGKTTSTKIMVSNTGTGAVQNIQVTLEGPLGWELGTEPAALFDLPPGGSRELEALFAAPAEASPGDYEIEVLAAGYSAQSPVRSPRRTIRVMLERSGTKGVLLAAGGMLLLLMAGILAVGLRMLRRER